MQLIARYALLFLLYSILGAIAETLFRLVTEYQLYGVHGYLHLPILPIYAVGSLIIVTLVGKHTRHPVLIFFGAALAATVLEFIAHWLIEMIFHVRIWDYSNNALNLFGRVSLESSLGFGLAALLLVYIIHPRAVHLLDKLPKKVVLIGGWLAAVMLLVDIVWSTIERLS